MGVLAGTTLYVANAGDSRCVVSREGCDNMTAVIVKFRAGFSEVRDEVADCGGAGASGPQGESSKRSGEVGTDEPNSKKPKLDSSE